MLSLLMYFLIFCIEIPISGIFLAFLGGCPSALWFGNFIGV